MSGIFGSTPDARRNGVLGGVTGLGEMSPSLAAQYADAMKQYANPKLAAAGYLAVDYGPPGPQTCWLVNTKYADGAPGRSQVLQYCAEKKIAGVAPAKAPTATSVTAALTTAAQAGANVMASIVGGAKVAYPWGTVSEATKKLQQEVNAFGKKMVDTGIWQTYCQVAEDGKLGPGTCGALRAAYGQNAIPSTCKEVATDCRGTKVGKGGSVATPKTTTVVTAPPAALPELLPVEESWLDRIGGIGTLIMGGSVVAALGIVGFAVAKKKGLIGKKKVKGNRRRRTRRNAIAGPRGSKDGDAYQRVRDEAQRLANETGRDYGVEKLGTPPLGGWRYFMLPEKRNRTGHELRCEVVSCESDAKMRKGHGYKNNRRRRTRRAR